VGAALNLQAAIFTLLSADVGLRALLATHVDGGSPTRPGIYDHVPQSAAGESLVPFPYLVVGDTTEAEWDADDSVGRESTITLHAWSRYLGMAQVKNIIDQVKVVLHNKPLSVSGENVIYCYWEFAEVFRDPDGITRHGVTRFRIVTQGT
jgi:hypothetical protein